MKRKFNLLVLFGSCILLFMLGSCSSSYYAWYDYDEQSYQYNKVEDQQARQNLMKTYNKMIRKPNGTLKKVPPGVYADYGYLLLVENKTEEGIKMLKKEIELYPASKPFIMYILKTLEEKQ